MVEKIKLIKSTFLKEKETKEKLCKFIMDSKVISMGPECEKFEKNFSLKQGRKYSVYVSSGSSANLLLIQALINLGKIKRGDKFFVSSLTWATNIMPLIQLGLIPLFLDVEKETLNVSSEILKKGYEKYPDTKGFFLTNALGFCSDIEKIKDFCQSKDIILLEDNCESLGSEYKKTKLGNFGFASTFSFFVGHHISTIEGGMVCTANEELYEILKMARAHGWTRSNSLAFKEMKKKEHNLDDFYETYTFHDLAYNVRPTEINGFIGNMQINYWDEIVMKREKNFKEFYEATLNNEDIVKLNIKGMNIISNFGFPLIFKDEQKFKEYKKLFIENQIEIRPIIGGNISIQPFITKWLKNKEELPSVEEIHKKGFYFGNNPEMNQEEIYRITSLLKKNKKKLVVGITGVTGTLGKILIPKLKEQKINYSCFNGDICSSKDIQRWVNENKFEAIIHFAAIVPTNQVNENPQKAYQVNVEGTKNLINEIKNSNQNPWLFYASTSHIYKSKDTPISEEDKIEPISIYGKTKYEAEEIINQEYENSCIGRIFSVYHNTQKPSFLYPNVLSRIKNEDLDKPFELFGANSIRDFLDAEVVADIIIKLMDKKTRGIYNIGSGKGTLIKDFVQKLTDKKLDIKGMGESNCLVADITKLKNILENEK
ncbi:MAG: DegT/DnrJ/EryC1/StrS family aminotransferase [archaeon]